MLKIVNESKVQDQRVVELRDMKPLQVGQIVDSRYLNRYVLRTARRIGLEVIDLSSNESNPINRWFDECKGDVKVRLLTPGEKITVELFNEE